MRAEGEDKIVSYDDSNVVIGGTGDVNAQIGDSDTGGTVAMAHRRLHGLGRQLALSVRDAC